MTELELDEDQQPDLPREGRLFGIDFGTVRIGLATCDPSQTWVTPFETYNRRNERLDEKYFVELAQKEEIAGWVIGLPIHCDGKESQKSGEVRAFATWLKERTELPYAFFDERFTTKEAKRLMQDSELSFAKRKKRVDRLAAHLILNNYLENRHAQKEWEDREVSQNEALDDGPTTP